MTHSEFITVTNKLIKISNINYNVTDLSNFNIIDIKTKNNIGYIVTNIHENNDYICFKLYGFNNLILGFNSNSTLEDCELFYFEDDLPIKYSESLLTCIILSFGLWIYETQAKYKILYKERGYELSQFKRKNYTIECKDDMSLDTVYINESSFIIYNYLKSEYFFVINNQEYEDFIKTSIYNKKQKSIVDNKISIDGILNARIENNHLKGKVKLLNKIVFIDIDPEKTISTKDDCSEEISNLNAFLTYINNTINYDHLQDIITKNVVDASFEQSIEDEKKLLEEYQKLKVDIYIKKVNIFSDCFMLVMGAPINYPNYNIYVQLDLNFNIDEITIN